MSQPNSQYTYTLEYTVELGRAKTVYHEIDKSKLAVTKSDAKEAATDAKSDVAETMPTIKFLQKDITIPEKVRARKFTELQVTYDPTGQDKEEENFLKELKSYISHRELTKLVLVDGGFHTDKTGSVVFRNWYTDKSLQLFPNVYPVIRDLPNLTELNWACNNDEIPAAHGQDLARLVENQRPAAPHATAPKAGLQKLRARFLSSDGVHKILEALKAPTCALTELVFDECQCLSWSQTNPVEHISHAIRTTKVNQKNFHLVYINPSSRYQSSSGNEELERNLHRDLGAALAICDTNITQISLCQVQINYLYVADGLMRAAKKRDRFLLLNLEHNSLTAKDLGYLLHMLADNRWLAFNVQTNKVEPNGLLWLNFLNTIQALRYPDKFPAVQSKDKLRDFFEHYKLVVKQFICGIGKKQHKPVQKSAGLFQRVMSVFTTTTSPEISVEPIIYAAALKNAGFNVDKFAEGQESPEGFNIPQELTDLSNALKSASLSLSEDESCTLAVYSSIAILFKEAFAAPQFADKPAATKPAAKNPTVSSDNKYDPTAVGDAKSSDMPARPLNSVLPQAVLSPISAGQTQPSSFESVYPKLESDDEDFADERSLLLQFPGIAQEQQLRS